uniref:Uncharacterized protein n=1 Tax=Schizaphis graminum TaxID=13262 RepID=A0A2S2NUS9_SCHGA
MYLDFYCTHMLFPTPLGFVSINKAPDTRATSNHTHTHTRARISDRGEREMSPKHVDRCAYRLHKTRYILYIIGTRISHIMYINNILVDTHHHHCHCKRRRKMALLSFIKYAHTYFLFFMFFFYVRAFITIC